MITVAQSTSVPIIPLPRGRFAALTVVGDGDSPGTVVRSSATDVVVVLASDGAALNAAVDGAGLNLPD